MSRSPPSTPAHRTEPPCQRERPPPSPFRERTCPGGSPDRLAMPATAGPASDSIARSARKTGRKPRGPPGRAVPTRSASPARNGSIGSDRAGRSRCEARDAHGPEHHERDRRLHGLDRQPLPPRPSHAAHLRFDVRMLNPGRRIGPSDSETGIRAAKQTHESDSTSSPIHREPDSRYRSA